MRVITNVMKPSISLVAILVLQLQLLISSGYCCADAFTIEPKSWSYKGHHIGYEEAKKVITTDLQSASKSTDPILLLNGFGVGSFHQHRLMPKLLHHQTDGGSSDKDAIIYGVDYLGQGRSWPVDCNDGKSPSEEGLIYSIDVWADQIITFIEEIIIGSNDNDTEKKKEKVHLVGNSVGGHLAVVLATKRPDLISSITLLNATPVWGLNLPGWSGHLPAPLIPRVVGRFLFDQIRNLGTIEKYLDNGYARREAFDDELMNQIRGCTEGKGGHAAFSSILWSPPATLPSNDFYSNISKLQCDVLLIFGKDDPWCKPSFGRRMFTELVNSSVRNGSSSSSSRRCLQRYVEIDSVGHCPNHEAPQAVAQLTSRWIKHLENSDENSDDTLKLVDGKEQVITEPWGDVVMREVNEQEAELSRMEKFITSMVG